jgi:hypothetical protein
MTDQAAQSVVLPPWKCPACGHANANSTARCTNKRYDPASRRYLAIPPVPPKYSLQTLGDYLESLGLAHVPPPAVIWQCPGRLECPVPGCGAPADAYGHGPRCGPHRTLLSVPS